jgi:hypothetical protein
MYVYIYIINVCIHYIDINNDFPLYPLLQYEAPKIAKMVSSPITMVYGTYNYSYWGL